MSKKITILDGGMGRLLRKMGAPFQYPEWSALALMKAPKSVVKAHNAFIEAGAEIITTNNYAVIPFHIGQDRFDEQGRSLIKLSGEIARQCANDAKSSVKVAGCLPPAFGSYRADLYDDKKADDIYIPMIEELEPYIDFWLAETISSVQEAQKIGELLKGNSKPFWLSFTVKDRADRKEKPQLRSNESIEQAIETAKILNVSALLFNCSQVEEMKDVLDIVQKSDLKIPYGVYANAFEPISQDQDVSTDGLTIREDNSVSDYLEHAKKWVSQGATIIGGCCGIGPEHIKGLKKLNS
tara:strand:- start:865 stop:1752 length:888 start_codon:yes stop_codon:yes gene_type:complete